jgi:hypothetical protein
MASVLSAAVATLVSVILSQCAAQTQLEVLANGKCYSTTSLHSVSNLAIVSMPLEREDILTIPQAPKIEIVCMELFEQMNLALDDGALSACDIPSQLWLCKTPADQVNAEWECEPLPAYIDTAKVVTHRGNVNGEEFRWKLQLDGNGKGNLCYPRDVTLQFLGQPIHPVKSTVAVVVAFAVIAGIAGVLATAFAIYQLRKLRHKFWKREAEPKADLTAFPATKALGEASPQPTSIAYGDEQLTAIPLPVPWFQRADFGAGSPNRTVAHGHGYGMNTTNLQMVGVGASGMLSPSPNPKVGGGGGGGKPFLSRPGNLYEEGPHGVDTYTYSPLGSKAPPGTRRVLTCMDCLMPIADDRTPVFCTVSGKRHK